MKPETTSQRCRATARNGKPCSAVAVADGLCAWHSPAWAEKRRAWSAAGGRARSNAARAKKALPKDVQDVTQIRAMLGRTIKGLMGGTIEPGVATAIASIARVSLAAIEQADRPALADLENRLLTLEADLLAVREGA